MFLAYIIKAVEAVVLVPAWRAEGKPMEPKRIVAGSSVYIEYEVRDQRVSPAALTDDFDDIVISLIDPDTLEAVVDEAPMEQQSTGRYIYQHQTGVDDSHGIWLAIVKVTKDVVACPPSVEIVSLSPQEPAFILTGPAGV